MCCSLITYTHSFPRVSLRQSVSRDSRQCRDYTEIVQSEQIHLWKDNGHQQVHQERGAAGVQAAHQTDSQDGELHLRWHVVINCCHASAFCHPIPRGLQNIQGTWYGWLGDVTNSGAVVFRWHIGLVLMWIVKTNRPHSQLPIERSSPPLVPSLSLDDRQLYPPVRSETRVN